MGKFKYCMLSLDAEMFKMILCSRKRRVFFEFQMDVVSFMLMDMSHMSLAGGVNMMSVSPNGPRSSMGKASQ